MVGIVNDGEGCLGLLIAALMGVLGAMVGFGFGRDSEREKWCKQAYVTATASDSLRLQRVDGCPLETP